jgi:hypothetical protein
LSLGIQRSAKINVTQTTATQRQWPAHLAASWAVGARIAKLSQEVEEGRRSRAAGERKGQLVAWQQERVHAHGIPHF